IPYKNTSQAVTDLISGEVSIYTAALSSSLQFIESGRVRIIAMVSHERSPLLPDVPTVSEGIGQPDYEASPNWYGLFAPAGTPPKAIASLIRAVNDIIRSEKFASFLKSIGAELVDIPSNEFTQQLRKDLKQYSTLRADLGIQK